MEEGISGHGVGGLVGMLAQGGGRRWPQFGLCGLPRLWACYLTGADLRKQVYTSYQAFKIRWRMDGEESAVPLSVVLTTVRMVSTIQWNCWGRRCRTK